MQYIDLTHTNIVAARNIHLDFMSYIIKKKLFGTAYKGSPPIPKMNQINKAYGIKAEIFSFLSNDDNLKDVLIGTPDVLEKIKDKFNSKGLKESINQLLNYKSWSDTSPGSTYQFYNAYDLAKNLDIPTCIYCNRIYTKTVVHESGKKITRPTFDHWYLQSKHPLLSLSFYNLIPSCSVCNSGLKAGESFDLTTHFHPYYKKEDLNLSYTFSYRHTRYKSFEFKIQTSNSFSERSVKAFELEEIYKAHKDEILDLIKIKEAYSDRYIEILEKGILKPGSVNRSEIYRLAFGVYFDEKDFDRRPLSKMKKDILKELGVI